MDNIQRYWRRLRAPRGERVTALAYCLLGYAIWACADVFAKFASSRDMPKYQLLALVAFGGMVSIGLSIGREGTAKKLRPRDWPRLTALALLGICTAVSIVIALPRIPFVQFYVIGFLSPMVIALLAALLLREKLDAQKIAAIVLGFLGVLVAVDPYKIIQGGGDLTGVLATFCMVASFSCQMLLLRTLGKTDTRESTTFWPRVICLGLYLCYGAIVGLEPMRWQDVILALGWGFVGGLGWLAVAEASRRASAATLAPCQYSQILFGAFFGYFFWKEIPTVNLLFGAAIIIASSAYMFRHARKLDKSAVAP